MASFSLSSQDNEPLMRALSKLVNLNNPDLVLFVGEALVGNDSIDQVTKFNQALKETAYGSGDPRLIDGIMLTKFDTIDDKVSFEHGFWPSLGGVDFAGKCFGTKAQQGGESFSHND